MTLESGDSNQFVLCCYYLFVTGDRSKNSLQLSQLAFKTPMFSTLSVSTRAVLSVQSKTCATRVSQGSTLKARLAPTLSCYQRSVFSSQVNATYGKKRSPLARPYDTTSPHQSFSSITADPVQSANISGAEIDERSHMQRFQTLIRPLEAPNLSSLWKYGVAMALVATAGGLSFWTMLAQGGRTSLSQGVIDRLEQDKEVLSKLGGAPLEMIPLPNTLQGKTKRHSGITMSEFEPANYNSAMRAKGEFRVTGSNGDKHGTVKFEVLKKQNSSIVYTSIVLYPDRGQRPIRVL